MKIQNLSSKMIKVPPGTVLSGENLDLVFEVLTNEGVILTHTPVGFTLLTMTNSGLERLFEIKQRPIYKHFSILGNPKVVGEFFGESVESKIKNFCHTVGFIQKISDKLILKHNISELLITEGKMAVFISLGPIVESIVQEAFQRKRFIFGTSANLSGRGNHYSLEEVEYQVRESVDLLVLSSHQVSVEESEGGKASPIFDLEKRDFVRKGLYQKEVEKELFDQNMIELVDPE